MSDNTKKSSTQLVEIAQKPDRLRRAKNFGRGVISAGTVVILVVVKTKMSLVVAQPAPPFVSPAGVYITAVMGFLRLLVYMGENSDPRTLVPLTATIHLGGLHWG